jgi:hypothetical protein
MWNLVNCYWLEQHQYCQLLLKKFFHMALGYHCPTYSKEIRILESDYVLYLEGYFTLTKIYYTCCKPQLTIWFNNSNVSCSERYYKGFWSLSPVCNCPIEEVVEVLMCSVIPQRRFLHIHYITLIRFSFWLVGYLSVFVKWDRMKDNGIKFIDVTLTIK